MIFLLLVLMMAHLAVSVIHSNTWIQSSKCVVLSPPCSAHAVCYTIMLKNIFLPNPSFMPAPSFNADTVGLPIILSAALNPAKVRSNCLGRQGNKKVQTATNHTHGTRSRSRSTQPPGPKRKAFNPYCTTSNFSVKKVRFQDANPDDSDVLQQLWGLQVSPIAIAPPVLHTQTDHPADGVLLDMEETDGDTSYGEQASQLTTPLTEQLKGLEKFFIVHLDPHAMPPTLVVDTNLDLRAVHQVTEPQVTTENVSQDATTRDNKLNDAPDIVDSSHQDSHTHITVSTTTTPDQEPPASNKNQYVVSTVTAATDMSASTNEANNPLTPSEPESTTTLPHPVDLDTLAQDTLPDTDDSEMVMPTDANTTSPSPTHITNSAATEPEPPALLPTDPLTSDQLTEENPPPSPNTTPTQVTQNSEDVMAVDHEDVADTSLTSPLTTPTHLTSTTPTHTTITAAATEPEPLTLPPADSLTADKLPEEDPPLPPNTTQTQVHQNT